MEETTTTEDVYQTEGGEAGLTEPVTWLDAVERLKRFIIAIVMLMGFWVSVMVVLSNQTEFGMGVLDKLILLVAVIISFYFGKQVGEGSV